MGYPLAVGSLDVNPQDITYEYSGWFYFTLILIGFLIGMAILGTAFYRKKRENWGLVPKIMQSFNVK